VPHVFWDGKQDACVPLPVVDDFQFEVVQCVLLAGVMSPGKELPSLLRESPQNFLLDGKPIVGAHSECHDVIHCIPDDWFHSDSEIICK